MQGKAPQHLARPTMDQIYVFIARTVPAALESRDYVAELLLEPILRTKCEPANIRMQTIGADHQIEAALVGMLELNLHVVRVLLKAGDFVAENNFRRAFDLLEQQPGKIAAPERKETTASPLRPPCGARKSA
jgi:hypothetical protein